MNDSQDCETSHWHIHRVVVPILDAVIMVVGLVGHPVVIYVLTRRNRKGQLRFLQGTDLLLLALSVSDLLLLTCLPFHTAAIVLGYWPFSSFLCKAISFLAVACRSASVFALAALAITRYLIVVHPTWTYRSRIQRGLRVSVLLMWVPAVALATPQFAFRQVNTHAIHCLAFLSDLAQLVYGLILFLFGFIFPLIVIVGMYAKLYSFLRKTRLQGAASKLEHYQNQVTKTSVLLVMVFTMCWLPSYIFMFLLMSTSSGGDKGLLHFAVIARLLSTASILANPLLYAFLSKKFRQELLALGLVSCKGCRCDK